MGKCRGKKAWPDPIPYYIRKPSLYGATGSESSDCWKQAWPGPIRQCTRTALRPGATLQGFFPQSLLDLSAVAVVDRASVLQTESELQSASRPVYLPALQAALVSLARQVLAGGAPSELAAVVLSDLPQPPCAGACYYCQRAPASPLCT